MPRAQLAKAEEAVGEAGDRVLLRSYISQQDLTEQKADELVAAAGRQFERTPANVRVLLNLDSDKPNVESVHFDNFEGFSGVANAGAGGAKLHFANNTYTITGTAQGSEAQRPTRLHDGALHDRSGLLSDR